MNRMREKLRENSRLMHNLFTRLSGKKPPFIMGIVNVTPDSFYDEGMHASCEQAVAHARALIEAGADILDIGGESSRPGAQMVDEDEECGRVIPVIRELGKQREVCISVDTTKSVVAKRALDSGASIINDISGLRFDPEMVKIVRERNASVVIMHMQGNPQTMQANPSYPKGVIEEICDFFDERIRFAESNGIARENILIDPGIGFGKTADHNLEILAQCDYLKKRFDLPLVIGASQKSFIGKILNLEPGDKEKRVWGTAAAVAVSVSLGADIVRVHHVSEMKMVSELTSEIIKKRNSIIHVD